MIYGTIIRGRQNFMKDVLRKNCLRYDTIIPWMEQLAADNPSFKRLLIWAGGGE